MKTILGIDFGTTTTVVAKISETGEPEIIDLCKDGNGIIATVLRLNDDREVVEWGNKAWDKYEDHPDSTFIEFKPELGSDKQYLYKSENKEYEISAEMLCEMFFKKIFQELCLHFNTKNSLESIIGSCIIGHPSSWDEKQRHLLEKM